MVFWHIPLCIHSSFCNIVRETVVRTSHLEVPTSGRGFGMIIAAIVNAAEWRLFWYLQLLDTLFSKISEFSNEKIYELHTFLQIIWGKSNMIRILESESFSYVNVSTFCSRSKYVKLSLSTGVSSVIKLMGNSVFYESHRPSGFLCVLYCGRNNLAQYVNLIMKQLL